VRLRLAARGRGWSDAGEFRNQLDAKQYAPMVEPAWVCSSARLRADLGWAPKHELADCLANAAKGYREAGVLKPARTRQLAA
jgi:nucleoside-diphosphate-sugar epimerase